MKNNMETVFSCDHMLSDHFYIRHLSLADYYDWQEICASEPEIGILYQVYPEDIMRHYWNQVIMSDDEHFSVFLPSGQICARLSIQYGEFPSPDIGITVVHRWQNQGIGTRLIHEWCNWIYETRKWSRMYIHMKEDNIRSYHIFKRNGAGVDFSENHFLYCHMDLPIKGFRE